MKILIITSPQEIGGGETYIRSLIKGLPNHHFLVITSLEKLATQLNLEGIQTWLLVTNVKFLSRLHIIFFLILAPLNIIQYLFYILIFNPDIIHIQSKEEQILVTPFAHLFGKKIIWTLHGPVEKGNRFVDFLFLKSSLMANKIIAISNFVKQSINSFGIKTDTVVIYHGIDTEKFKPLLQNTDQKIIGYVGRLIEIKRPKLFLEVAFKVLEKVAHAKAWLVGEGNLKKEMENIVSASLFKERVKFLGFREDIENIIRQFTVLIVTSKTEGLNMAVLEAFASGVPVVSVDVGALSEIVSKETGLLIDQDNPEVIAAQIIKIIQNNNLLKALKKNCRQIAQDKFSLDRMLVETDLVYTT